MKRTIILVLLLPFIFQLYAQKVTYSNFREGNGISIQMELASYIGNIVKKFVKQ